MVPVQKRVYLSVLKEGLPRFGDVLAASALPLRGVLGAKVIGG